MYGIVNPIYKNESVNGNLHSKWKKYTSLNHIVCADKLPELTIANANTDHNTYTVGKRVWDTETKQYYEITSSNSVVVAVKCKCNLLHGLGFLKEILNSPEEFEYIYEQIAQLEKEKEEAKKAIENQNKKNEQPKEESSKSNETKSSTESEIKKDVAKESKGIAKKEESKKEEVKDSKENPKKEELKKEEVKESKDSVKKEEIKKEELKESKDSVKKEEIKKEEVKESAKKDEKKKEEAKETKETVKKEEEKKEVAKEVTHIDSDIAAFRGLFGDDEDDGEVAKPLESSPSPPAKLEKKESSIVVAPATWHTHEYFKSRMKVVIPIRVIIAKDSIISYYFHVACNTSISVLSSFIEKTFGFKRCTLKFKNKDISSPSSEIWELGINPYDTLLLYAHSQYQIFKRLEIRSQIWNVGSSDWDAICMKIKKQCYLCGFSAYSMSETQMRSELEYKIKLNGTLYTSKKVPIAHDPSKIVKYEFEFQDWVHLKPNDNVILMYAVRDGKTFSGNNGKTSCDFFTIENTNDCNNGTDSGCGQFPEIFYSEY